MTLDLNDVRHFVAVARAGSTLAASRGLGVNQTTCARRIAALEGALGLTLFERAASGYRLTASGTALLEHAERIETASVLMTQAAQQLARNERAEIRFSTSDVLADLVAGPAVASFARLYPDIRVALSADSRAVNLSRNEADVVLRAAPVMNDPHLVARKIMDTPWAFYCATTWAAQNTVPATLDQAVCYPMAALAGRPAEMLRAAFPGANIRTTSNSMNAMVEVIKAGDCIGALPMLVGEPDGALKRCFVLDLDAGGLWIMFHERLRHAVHIKLFVDHLVAHLRAWRQGLPRAADI